MIQRKDNHPTSTASMDVKAPSRTREMMFLPWRGKTKMRLRRRFTKARKAYIGTTEAKWMTAVAIPRAE
jgi:hypothetical protein